MIVSLATLAALAPIAALAEPTQAAWRSLAQADVEALGKAVLDVHPLVVDPARPDFKVRVQIALDLARQRASKAQDYAGWRFATEGFVQSFRDGHVIFRPELVTTRVRWPGFLIDAQGDRYVVRRLTGVTSQSAEPIDGSEVVSCDGSAIDLALAARLDMVVADWSKVPEQRRQAFRFFLDQKITGAPPTISCRFRTDAGLERDIRLDWRPVSWLEISPKLDVFLREVERPVGYRTLDDGTLWLELGSFGDHKSLESLAKTLETKGEAVRDAPLIVVDLRGNRGGSSSWGQRFASIIYGKAAVEAALEHAARGVATAGLGKFWRTTPEAEALLRQSARRFEESGDIDAARYFNGIADLVSNQRALGKELAEDPCCAHWKLGNQGINSGPTLSSAYSGTVLLLTDAGCFSSCISAIVPFDLLGARRVGETTGQNGEGGEVVGPISAPSGLARYFIPASVIRDGNVARPVYPVEFKWSGSMDDTPALERWIQHLAKDGRFEPLAKRSEN